MTARITWPDGKRFAFTVFDDTDFSTLRNGPGLYRLLHDLGFRTTKSVWPIRGPRKPRIGGTTCAEPDYLEWIRQLEAQGFEIALHNVTYHSSTREQIIAGLEQFKTYFGRYPNIHTNHAHCEDDIYWGDARMTGLNRAIYHGLTRLRARGLFRGHIESSEFFWGDLCKERIKYVRNFVFSDINTLRACPGMPYFDQNRPFVKYWFASSEGSNCRSFCNTLSPRNQLRLEEEGGACIMYTHFGASDFHRDGQIDPAFARLMTQMSRRPGWFVPVSTLLDHILAVRGPRTITAAQRHRMELKWLIERPFSRRWKPSFPPVEP